MVTWSNHNQWAIIAKEKPHEVPWSVLEGFLFQESVQDLEWGTVHDSVAGSGDNFRHIFHSVSGSLVWGTYTPREP